MARRLRKPRSRTANVYIPPLPPPPTYANPTTTTTIGKPTGTLPYPGPSSPAGLPASPFPGYLTPQQIQQQADASAAPFNSLLSILQGGIGAMQGIGEQGVSGITNAYAGAADALKAIGPAISTAYNQAAGDTARLGAGYAGGLQSALNAETAPLNEQLSRVVGAPAGQMISSQPAADAAAVLNATAGSIPAAMYAKQGGAYADAASFLPGSAVAQGKIASANFMQSVNSQITDVYKQMQQAAVDAFSAKLQRGEALSDQQLTFFQNAQTQALNDKKDAMNTAFQLYNAGLISPRDLGQQLGLPNWQTMSPDLATDPAKLHYFNSNGVEYAFDESSGKTIKVGGTAKTAGATVPAFDAALSKHLGYLVDKNRAPILDTNKQRIPYQAGTDAATRLQHVTVGGKAYSFDPSTGTYYDPATGKAVAPRKAPGAAGGTKLQKATVNGKPAVFDPGTGRYYDPVTRQELIPQYGAKPPQGAPGGKPRFTPAQIAGFKSDAADTARSLFYGRSHVDKATGDTVVDVKPHSYQEAMAFLQQHGIPLAIAQQALNQYWKKPGFEVAPASRDPNSPNKAQYFRGGGGRPQVPYQERHPKGSAAPSGGVAVQAVAQAVKEKGVPYQWGGESPQSGFDCSGLIYWAYQQAGKTIPRTSQEQYRHGKRVGSIVQAQPGDLVFYAGSDGTTRNPGHVALYIGDGKVIVAPHSGTVIQVVDWDSIGGFAGIRRYG